MVCGDNDSYTEKSSCWSYAAVIVVIVVGLAWLISKMVIGGIYFNQCPAGYLIPIWLIVSGLAPLCLYSLLSRCMNEHEDSALVYFGVNIFNILVVIFILAWNICGTVWVSQVRQIEAACTTVQSTSGGADCISCNHFLSTFALCVMIVEWCIVALVIVWLLLLFLYDKFKLRQPKI